MDKLKEIYQRVLKRLEREVEPTRADETFNLAVVGVLAAVGACLYGAIAAKTALLIAGIVLAPLLVLLALAAKDVQRKYAAQAAKRLEELNKRQDHQEKPDDLILAPLPEDDE